MIINLKVPVSIVNELEVDLLIQSKEKILVNVQTIDTEVPKKVIESIPQKKKEIPEEIDDSINNIFKII